ncbi:MAG: bifunctional homocysteine S-methyltransferase/methylenetetrahydrofolate reductase [Sedimentisphaerales bacterium]|nr:bifunctional homocysteine S-methyltransferase/methylenetetrahydrofolate reductase [Sedimentisphaerales bacterium]
MKELLSQRVIIGDGAMGTMLYAKGVFVNTCFDELCLTNSNLIKDIHSQYVAAGADFIETNSFGASEIKLAKFGLADKVEEINCAAAEIAKKCAGDKVFAAGAVGPLGVDIAQGGRVSEKEVIQVFANQIKALVKGGVDFLLFETFSNLKELLLAIKAGGEVCQLPIVAQMTVTEYKETLYGDKLSPAMAALGEIEQVIAVGLNCSLGPAAMLESLEFIKKATTKPVSLQPNAGLPRSVDGRTLYMCTPEYMAEYAKRFYEKGVRIIGGCCGTTPEHIKQIAKAVKALDKAMMTRPSAIKISPAPKEAVRQKPVSLKAKSKFGAKLAAGKKVITVEITPPRGSVIHELIEKVRFCRKAGIDAVNIPDGPRASSRLSAMITAIKIEQACNIETILHFCCRDRNIIAMQSDLLGIHTVGLRNILVITGDPPKVGEYPDATGVFDLDSVALTSVIRDLNCGIDIAGNGFASPTSLVIGVGANPVASDLDREIERYRAKVAAGAEYAITQPVFDAESFLNFLDKTKDCKIPVIAGIWPFTSYKNAEFMANEVPGVVVPQEFLNKMSQARDRAQSRRMGVEIARGLIKQINDHVAGFAISAPFGDVKMALAVAGKIDVSQI